MPLARHALFAALILTGSSAAWAEALDKHACNVLKVELAGLLAVGVKDDMERGPKWAKANLTKEKLTSIRRLIEVEEQLEFRCGMNRARVVAVTPAEAPPPAVVPESPERNPSKAITGKKADSVSSSITKSAKSPSGAKKPVDAKPADTKTAEKAKKPAADTEPATTAAVAEPKKQAPPARKTQREAKTYVSPQEVNPYSLSRYGSGR